MFRAELLKHSSGLESSGNSDSVGLGSGLRFCISQATRMSQLDSNHSWSSKCLGRYPKPWRQNTWVEIITLPLTSFLAMAKQASLSVLQLKNEHQGTCLIECCCEVLIDVGKYPAQTSLHRYLFPSLDLCHLFSNTAPHYEIHF